MQLFLLLFILKYYYIENWGIILIFPTILNIFYLDSLFSFWLFKLYQ